MSNILNLSIKNSPIKVAIFLAFLIGVLFRIYNLNYDYLWFDEIVTFWISDPNLLISESYARYKETEAIPFLHYFLLKVCHQLFGYAPEVGRYFSAIFGILSILTLGYLAKQISNNKSFLLVIYLTSLNIFLISYSQEMRVYIFTFFLSTVNLIFFYKLINNTEKRNFLYLILFCFFQILNIYSFPFTLIIFLSIIAYTIYQYIFFKKRYYEINISIIVVSIFLIFFIPYYFNASKLHVVGWIIQPDIKFYTNFYFSKFFGSRLMGIVHLSLLIYLILKFKKTIFTKDSKKLVLLFIIFLSYFLPLTYGYIFSPVIFPRYIIFVLIPIILLISILIFEIKNKLIKNFLIIIIVFLNLGNHYSEATFKQFIDKRNFFKPDFKSMINLIYQSPEKNFTLDLSLSATQEKNINNAISSYIERESQDINSKIKFINKKQFINSNKKTVWVVCLTTVTKNKCEDLDLSSNMKKLKTQYFSGIKLELIEKQ